VLAAFNFSADMPKEGEMAQLSRPFQIAFVAVALFAGVWLAALRGHSSGTSGSGSSPATPAPAPAASSKASPPSGVYHGSAPGVEGLTRATAKAKGAVATSQQNAKQLEQKANEASTTGGTPGAPTASASKPATHAAARAHAPATAHKTPSKPTKSTAQAGPNRKPARQVLVERALHEGKIAVILFWNKKGADDVATRAELRLLEAVHHVIRPIAGHAAVRRALQRSGLELQKKFAAFEATAKQVASFGSITKGVQVNGTPTLLIVNKRGQVRTLTGLTDAYSMEQAIDEARHS
jgi:hypothetical protein